MNTHEVLNQPEPLKGRNLYTIDKALQEALHREGGEAFADEVEHYGSIAGGELMEIGFEAEEYPPRLHTHDRFGHRRDEVQFHPAYHRAMALGVAHGLTSLTWSGRPGGRIARSAKIYLHYQTEAGSQCPLTMTHAAVPSLRNQPAVADVWVPRILSGTYDPSFQPASSKQGATIGMFMTEKQGGSDVRTNTTRAVPTSAPGPGEAYELTGHKWFCSAPMSDAFLTLAQADGGLSCFLVPRWRPDGAKNDLRIQRLKKKLGNRSNASSEIELFAAHGVLIGQEGRGVATIIEMVAETRLDCAICSGGLMRQALSQALQHCSGREVFGALLVDQPLMKNVLADLAIEAEAALMLAMRLARAFEHSADPKERLLARIATPVAKYWTCKRAPMVVNEAQECLGGAGYVEESVVPRLYREAPLNAIWEGSGNVQALDVLRAISRTPETLEAFFAEVDEARGENAHLDGRIDALKASFADKSDPQLRARRILEEMALTLQGALLVRAGNDDVADTFCASRLGDEGYRMLGTLPSGAPIDALLKRAWPG